MSGFDYVALGHIHKPEMDEKNRMAYCGSLEPIDMNDMGERGYIYGEVTKNSLELEFVPFAKRIYKEIDFQVTTTATNMEIRHRLTDMIEENGKDIVAVDIQRGTDRPYYLAKKPYRILIFRNYMKIIMIIYWECLLKDIWTKEI